MKARGANPDAKSLFRQDGGGCLRQAITLICLLIAVAFGNSRVVAAGPTVQVWVSSEDMKHTLTAGKPLQFVEKRPPSQDTIKIEDSQSYQAILGMGSSLEPTTCYNIALLPSDEQERVIESLVNPTSGIGMNLMRICIGTPDFTGDPWYSYDDMPPGKTDPELQHFSIEKDRRYIIPVLKLALKKNHDLLFFASPWSPPGWMTSTDNMIGGHLLPEYYGVYAQYFVRFIRAYEAEGIPIYAVTIQNEPGVDRSLERNRRWHYPSCRWTGEQERDFIKNHLGPAFRSHQIKTRIWCYDHNFNVGRTRDGDDPGIAYPRTVLRDPDAAQYVDGVAFHGYAGKPDGMSVFHGEFPEAPLYFTEGSAFRTRGALRIISYFRNWASSYNAWVTMIDEKRGPNNGPFRAGRTCITLNTSDLRVAYHFDYYMYGQFMKFVRRGARRIESNETSPTLSNVAFKNPDGTIVLVVANVAGSKERFAVQWRAKVFQTNLEPRSVATFRWVASD